MGLHLGDQVFIPLDVVIAAHGVSGATQEGSFEDQIVIGITTNPQTAGRHYLDGSYGQQPQEFADFPSIQSVFLGDARTRQDFGQFIQERDGNDSLKVAARPGILEFGRCAMRVDER